MIRVLYHGGCYDGFGAAWAAYQQFKDEAEYIPVYYGQSPPDDVRNFGGTLYILDFSYSPRELETFKAEKIVVLDHHMSTMKDWAQHLGLDETPESTLTWVDKSQLVYFDMNRSGAGIAWDYFQVAKPRPALINYMEDRDLWRFKLPYTKEIFAWMQSWPMSFYRWDVCAQMLDTQFERVLDQAMSIKRFKDAEVHKMVREAELSTVCGRPLIPVVNASCFFSDVADELLKRHPEAPFVAYYFDRQDGNRQWGLRSDDNREDVSIIAKAYGGGGHRNAAGFIQTL